MANMKNKKLWAKESLKRYKAMASGKVSGKPTPKVFDHLREDLHDLSLVVERKNEKRLSLKEMKKGFNP